MIAVILAAGMASRLRPLTNDRPKCLLEVGRRTLLQRTVDALLEAGLREFVVVTGYRGEMIRQFLTKQYPDQTFHFIDNAIYDKTNNIYSLWLTRPFTDGKDFLLLDSDILFDPALLRPLLDTPAAALAVNRHELGEEEVKAVVDEAGQVVGIGKQYAPDEAFGESVGIEKMTADYSAALFETLTPMIETEGLVNVFYEAAFQRLAEANHFFMAIDTTSFFSIELDTVEDFQRAQEFIPPHLF